MGAHAPVSGEQTALDKVMRWIALDFDGHSWKAIAGWLFGAQVVVFAISRVVDAVWFPETSYGFFAAMFLFAGYVALDSLQVGMGLKRSVLWASAVTLLWIFGAIPYARRRQHLRRNASFQEV
jgi:hypothetical protein